jgi:hypothetical protein
MTEEGLQSIQKASTFHERYGYRGSSLRDLLEEVPIEVQIRNLIQEHSKHDLFADMMYSLLKE